MELALIDCWALQSKRKSINHLFKIELSLITPSVSNRHCVKWRLSRMTQIILLTYNVIVQIMALYLEDVVTASGSSFTLKLAEKLRDDEND